MAENMTKQSSEEEDLRKLLMEDEAGEGGGKKEDPSSAPVPPADSPSKPEESHPVFALYEECVRLVKGLPKPVQGAFTSLVKGNQPVWPGGILSDDKKKEAALGLYHKRSRLEQLKVAMLDRLEVAKQRDNYQKQVEEATRAAAPAPQPAATPPAAPSPPVQAQPATTTKPEWDALPLWAKWTIGGVGAGVVLIVVILAVIAIASI